MIGVDENFDSDLLELHSLLLRLKSLESDSLLALGADTENAIKLLEEFDKIEDLDTKDDIGYEYSELITNIIEELQNLNKDGINLYIQ